MSPGVFAGVQINSGLECHNDQTTDFAFDQVEFLAHSGLPRPRWVARGEVMCDKWYPHALRDPSRQDLWPNCQTLEIANSRPF